MCEAWGPWVMDEWTRDRTTVVLSLTLLRFKEEEKHGRNRGSGEKIAKVLRVWPCGIEQDHFRALLGSEGVRLRFGKLATILEDEKIPAYRVFGNLGGEREAAVVIMPPVVSVPTLLVQHMFS